jgi:hypothetical protein
MVMAGLVPAIHVFLAEGKDVNVRHQGRGMTKKRIFRAAEAAKRRWQ